MGRGPTHNESAFKFVKDFPYNEEDLSLFFAYLLPFHRSFIVDRRLVFVPNAAVVLIDNARVTTCNCCAVFNSAGVYVEKNDRVISGVSRGNSRIMLDCVGVLGNSRAVPSHADVLEVTAEWYLTTSTL
jgi:hypothetical protein